MAAISERRSIDSNSDRSFYKTNGSLHSYSSAASILNHGESEHLTPRTFLDRYSLPRVVKIVPQEPVDGFDSGPMSLLSGELLMYKQYRSGKVEARSQVKTKNGQEIVSLVVIPDTYQGWFSVVTERRQVKARCYNSLHRLVSAQVTVFLSMSDIIAYTHNNSRSNTDGTRLQYSKTVIKCGQVLKLLAVYQDLSNQSTRSKRLSWPLIGRHEANRYAQCLTSTDQVLFIPITTHGQFYAIATATNSTDDTVSKVYQLSKLLRTFPLPVRVCIITPNKPQGSMLLESYHKEDVILTCLLDSCTEGVAPIEDDDLGIGGTPATPPTTTTQFRLLEMDINSRFYVLRLGPRELDERRLFQSGLVQRAMRYCRENSEKWCRQLKVIHHIYPRGNENGTVERLATTTTPPSNNNKSDKRKISLGDKKTVKSASFRFSTSYHPEDLRPLNRPLPRRPVEVKVPTPPKNPTRTNNSLPPPATTMIDDDDAVVKKITTSHPLPEPIYSDYDSIVAIYSNVADDNGDSTESISNRSSHRIPLIKNNSLQLMNENEHKTVWASPLKQASLETKLSNLKVASTRQQLFDQRPASYEQRQLNEQQQRQLNEQQQRQLKNEQKLQQLNLEQRRLAMGEWTGDKRQQNVVVCSVDPSPTIQSTNQNVDGHQHRQLNREKRQLVMNKCDSDCRQQQNSNKPFDVRSVDSPPVSSLNLDVDGPQLRKIDREQQQLLNEWNSGAKQESFDVCSVDSLSTNSYSDCRQQSQQCIAEQENNRQQKVTLKTVTGIPPVVATRTPPAVAMRTTPVVAARIPPVVAARTPPVVAARTPPTVAARTPPAVATRSVDKASDYKMKITINDSPRPVFGDNERIVRPMYRVVRKAPGSDVKPFFKTRVQIGSDYSSSTDVPYSVVADHISTATSDDNVYAEIAGDSYQTSRSRYFSFGYQRPLNHYDYRNGGGSDGTFSNTTTSSSNADESSV